ncbi:hypothetical protein, partial [Liquorilactobacillus satsumensis]|uniref:hypothetical protein n=1 Tax=Liquorilactobacillus satsumensis TaxID=259059 RepID=UPI0039E87A31
MESSSFIFLFIVTQTSDRTIKRTYTGILTQHNLFVQYLIGHTGLEPVHCGFRVRCLTNLAN